MSDKFFELVWLGLSMYGPGIVVLILILLIILVLSFKTKLVDKLIDIADARREEKHLAGMKQRDKKTQIINERLARLLLDTNSDRAVVFEYHNNGQNLSGLPFVHVSAHAEAAAPCLLPVSHKFQNMPSASFYKTIQNFNKTDLIVIDDVEKECDEQPLLCEYFKTFDAKQLFISPIEGIKHQLGFVVIARNKKRAFTPQDKSEIRTAMQTISSILDAEDVQKLLKK